MNKKLYNWCFYAKNLLRANSLYCVYVYVWVCARACVCVWMCEHILIFGSSKWVRTRFRVIDGTVHLTELLGLKISVYCLMLVGHISNFSLKFCDNKCNSAILNVVKCLQIYSAFLMYAPHLVWVKYFLFYMNCINKHMKKF